MPIEAPSNTSIGSRTHSEFVLCEGFAFRPSNVDGCSHQAYADGSAVTIDLLGQELSVRIVGRNVYMRGARSCIPE